MYLPRSLISRLYLHLLRTHHPLSPPVLLLVALEPDALCACRILTYLLKRDYIPHKIQPISGYGDLARAGEELVRPMRTTEGGSGGVVVCLGVGGLVDLSVVLSLQDEEDAHGDMGEVEVWVIDARRPWNLGNVFGVQDTATSTASENGDGPSRMQGVDNGRIQQNYKPGKGGIIVFDDGDIDEELGAEREAYCALVQMPDVEDDGEESDGSEPDSDDGAATNGNGQTKKRKFSSDREDEDDESEDEDHRPRQRRRIYSSSSINSSPSRPPRHGLISTSNNLEVPDSTDASPSGSPSCISHPRAPTSKPPSPRTLRRRLLRLRRKHEAVLRTYYALGTSYSEPISSILYSLASELGREDNDLLWLAIVGVGSMELYGRSMTGVGISHVNDSGGSAGWGGERGERIRQVLRDEVRRLNPPGINETSQEMSRGETSGVIPTTARSPTDTSIRLSPEPRFLLIRHWSLYDSMLHSPYLSARLHIWSDKGRKRLHKLLAKMGVSLSQCKQNYTHMDMDLKRGLRERLLKYAPVYGLEGLVPPATSYGRGREGWGFVRSWGWKACLSAVDVGVVVGAILEVGKGGVGRFEANGWERGWGERSELRDEEGKVEGEEWVGRFWEAYDALENINTLKSALPTAQHLHRAILRTGTSLLSKHQIRHLSAFRMAVVKEGPDVQLFTHPAALTKLALWVGEAIAVQENDSGRHGGRGTPLVVAGLNEKRGVYVVVGTGGGGGVGGGFLGMEGKGKKEVREKRKAEKAAEKERKRKEREEREDGDDEEETEDESDDDDDDDEDEEKFERDKARGYGRNRFANAFQEVVDETNARVRIDSFEHCVVEVRKEDLTGFLEGLSMKAVIG
ncbi:MAG: hypothetical protein M1835_002719 [Candelina submexicana]|nr:MAG: hypothetical protein M1835_002719 [Candelina submexicana]